MQGFEAHAGMATTACGKGLWAIFLVNVGGNCQFKGWFKLTIVQRYKGFFAAQAIPCFFMT
jgi:hypothetical protein